MMSTVSAVYKNVRGLQTAIKDVGRLRLILTVLAKHGFGAVVTRLNMTEAVGIKGLMEYKDENKVVFSRARLAHVMRDSRARTLPAGDDTALNVVDVRHPLLGESADQTSL